jgi:hypothetical protein
MIMKKGFVSLFFIGLILLTACQSPTNTTAYSLSFNSNGGEGTMNSLPINSGDSVTLSSNTFTRAGYTFSGWATEISFRLHESCPEFAS